jgi:hypothetical protein
MTQAESKVSQDICKVLRLNGVFCFKVHGGPTMVAGLPDIIACVDGYFVGFETKMPAKRKNVSPRQAFIHEQIRASQGKAIVVCSAQEAMSHVDEIRRTTRPTNRRQGK